MLANHEPFSLYIHIPYCASKCPYCNFNSHVVPKIPEGEYTAALLQELDFYALSDDWHGRNLKSIFFGGGTPSTFGPVSIGKILGKTASLFPFEQDIEITLEANPSTADSRNFYGYRSYGVNRISIGVQSFCPHLLRFLGRVHTAKESREALRTVRQVGFENFNLDLIYASPGQSLSDLEADLVEALSFHPPHLSTYNLTIEEGTPFHQEHRAGKIRPIPEQKEISMAELIEETLSGEGLEHYEISNYARTGFQSRHNVNYWQGGDYLGIGAGAHSYKQIRDNGLLGHRWHNEKNPGRYMDKINWEGKGVAGEEVANLQEAAGEYMFLGLRMIQGISVKAFSRRFGKKPDEFYPQISEWVEEGLMEKNEEQLRLTRRGLLVANSIFVKVV
ncbi:MAG: radical SAM family heme chaperone HemW [Candidatus Binatia bacterium]